MRRPAQFFAAPNNMPAGWQILFEDDEDEQKIEILKEDNERGVIKVIKDVTTMGVKLCLLDSGPSNGEKYVQLRYKFASDNFCYHPGFIAHIMNSDGSLTSPELITSIGEHDASGVHAGTQWYKIYGDRHGDRGALLAHLELANEADRLVVYEFEVEYNSAAPAQVLVRQSRGERHEQDKNSQEVSLERFAPPFGYVVRAPDLGLAPMNETWLVPQDERYSQLCRSGLLTEEVRALSEKVDLLLVNSSASENSGILRKLRAEIIKLTLLNEVTLKQNMLLSKSRDDEIERIIVEIDNKS